MITNAAPAVAAAELTPEQRHELRGARVPPVVIGKVTVPLLVQLITAGDVVDGDPAAPGQLVQRGQL